MNPSRSPAEAGFAGPQSDDRAMEGARRTAGVGPRDLNPGGAGADIMAHHLREAFDRIRRRRRY